MDVKDVTQAELQTTFRVNDNGDLERLFKKRYLENC